MNDLYDVQRAIPERALHILLKRTLEMLVEIADWAEFDCVRDAHPSVRDAAMRDLEGAMQMVREARKPPRTELAMLRALARAHLVARQWEIRRAPDGRGYRF